MILSRVLKVNFQVSISTPVPEPKAEPCFGFLLSLLSGVFRGLSFGGYGGQLGPGFVGGYPYYPGVYYGAPYYPYYPYYPYPYYPGPVVVNPGGPIVNPGGPIIVNPGGPIINPGGPIIVNPGGPIINPGRPIVVGK